MHKQFQAAKIKTPSSPVQSALPYAYIYIYIILIGYYLYLYTFIIYIYYTRRGVCAILNGPSEPLNGQADHHQSDWQFLGKNGAFFFSSQREKHYYSYNIFTHTRIIYIYIYIHVCARAGFSTILGHFIFI